MAYCVLDLETTGLNPAENEIIEVAAIKVDQNGSITSYTSLIKPKLPIPGMISEITGITNEMVSCSRGASEVLPEFLEFVGDSMIVGHNVQAFDIPFLEQHAKRAITNATFDTLLFSRRKLPDLKHSLSALCQHFHISCDGAHRALRDCEMTKGLFLALSQDGKG